MDAMVQGQGTYRYKCIFL